MAEEKRRLKERLRQEAAIRKIFRIWRTFRVIKFSTAILSFVRFRRFHERIAEARDLELFRKRIIEREKRERIVFESYQQRNGKLLLVPGSALADATADFSYPRRKAVEVQRDTEEDLVSLWMKNKFSRPVFTNQTYLRSGTKK